MTYWITMPAGTASFCLTGSHQTIPDPETARSLVIRHLTQAPVAVDELPYAARPCLHVRDDGSREWAGQDAMLFCHDPARCKGRSSCPKHPACNE